MAEPPDPLPADPAELVRIIRDLEARNADLQAQVKTLKAMIFGAKSERAAMIDPEQGVLDLGDLAVEAAPAANDNADRTSGKPGRHPRRPANRNVGALPRHLPRVETTIEPESTACPCCAGPMHRIGEDVAEALDVIPALVRVLRTIRPKYACRCCRGTLVQAAARPRVVDGGMATTALVAHVVVAKFAWHLPLYRQSRMFAGQGIALDRTTLVFWVRRAAWWLKPLYERLLLYIRSQERVFCDETPLPRLDPGRGRTRICQLWAQAVDDRPWQGPARPAVGYVFAEGRDTAAIQDQLAGFDGLLQVDGYVAYKALVRRRRRATIRLVFCLSHARRKFVAVFRTTRSEVAREVIGRLGEVYAIEARIRGTTAETRLRVRQDRSRPILEALKVRLMAVRAEISGQSSLAKAISYTLGHWDGLVAFLEDGRIEVDTNTVERLMRPIGLGRKNALFAGSAAGGRDWAILASLINSARLNGLDPFSYLADVLERIVSGAVKANDLDRLLPWAWKAERGADAGTVRAA
ncbi:IS66 family transposase (plasmid) [Skermanella sp. TT6]|uniref:IS66 family transposase n=1 Tax=Skermanella cutis TaxID=2775420 RepID=A0ABX7B298_9PROT|nr:IS66 family transposase [Skermanella sp. TT6]QQP87557.1 IS66 family transposase [Skermanella sp. TT6]QQP87560.1 IS66 family transposase [Skermanella sp. TT6]QQP88169.1 IS66 family transposase [Skermanella sp. TT6]QQP89464.1 IS66 family transposase [Skermanella sp. TT6]QQP89467.1 IS66 family transposase [Skermanella sp. TT6]